MKESKFYLQSLCIVHVNCTMHHATGRPSVIVVKIKVGKLYMYRDTLPCAIKKVNKQLNIYVGPDWTGLLCVPKLGF